MARSSQHVAGDLLPGGNSNLLSGGRSGARVAVPVRRHCLRIKVHLQGTRATLNQLPTGRTGTDPTHCGTTVAHPPHAVIQRPHWGGGKADWAGGHAGGWGPWDSNNRGASAAPHRENNNGSTACTPQGLYCRAERYNVFRYTMDSARCRHMVFPPAAACISSSQEALPDP